MLGEAGSEFPLVHCLTAGGKWAMVLLHGTATLPGSIGPWGSFTSLPRRFGTACTATLLESSGQWASFSALPYHWGAASSGSPSVGSSTHRHSCSTLLHRFREMGHGSPVHCLPAWEQRAVDLVHYSASVLGSIGQWISCGTLPDCGGGEVGNGTLPGHYHTAEE